MASRMSTHAARCYSELGLNEVDEHHFASHAKRGTPDIYETGNRNISHAFFLVLT